MTEHHVKSWPEFFEPIVRGYKHFDLRKADRDYSVGDILILHEWEPSIEKYTGRELRRRINYILNRATVIPTIPLRGLEDGYCILGLMSTSNG